MVGSLPAGDADETGGGADRPRLHLQLHPHLALAQRGAGGVALLTRSMCVFKDLLGALLPGRQVSVLWPCEVRYSIYTQSKVLDPSEMLFCTLMCQLCQGGPRVLNRWCLAGGPRQHRKDVLSLAGSRTMTPTQAHHERVLKVLNEEGETPPSWIGHILLCRCAAIITWMFLSFLFETKLIGWL